MIQKNIFFFVHLLHLIEAIKEAVHGCLMNKVLAHTTCRGLEKTIKTNGYLNASYYCFICYSDGCNGSIEPHGSIKSNETNESSGAAQYGPIALLISLPVAIVKFSSF